VRRPRLPFARRGAEDSAAESPPTPSTAADAGTEKLSTTAQAPATPQAAGQTRADPHERIDGLRAWVAQVDRKLGVRTYVGAAIAVLALAAAAVSLVLTLSLKQDAATNDDVQSLRDQITAVQQSASQAAQKDVQALDQRLTDLEAEVSRMSSGQTTTRRELRVVQDDIKELRSQVSGAGGSSGGLSQSFGGSAQSPGGGSASSNNGSQASSGGSQTGTP
jgi:septal ring factor EnvC (AmiA/AmiB activator)